MSIATLRAVRLESFAGILSERALWMWPTIAFVTAFALLQLGGLDRVVAHWLADGPGGGFPLRHFFWTQTVLHDGGRLIMQILAGGLLLLWAASHRAARLAPYRSTFAYTVLAVALSVLSVNIGKHISGLDCPWSVDEFGGDRPHFTLFDARPVDLAPGHCFPGGHSSAGFALFALFFAVRRHRPGRARRALLAPLVIGGVFALTQWVRGAHFVSHDLTTAWLCWMIAWATDAWTLRRRLPGPAFSRGVARTPARRR
ncbi:MAG: phosphatase PAP2 family protein [Chromatiales bacterium]|nr:phosphatase PAP2 family protein [Chromatiales bacterium]